MSLQNFIVVEERNCDCQKIIPVRKVFAKNHDLDNELVEIGASIGKTYLVKCDYHQHKKSQWRERQQELTSKANNVREIPLRESRHWSL